MKTIVTFDGEFKCVEINGWYFNFEHMFAFKKGNANEKRELWSVGTPPSILKKRFDIKEPRTNFFSEPECHFNNKIDQAYHEFLLTESIEDMLINNTESDLK